MDTDIIDKENALDAAVEEANAIADYLNYESSHCSCLNPEERLGELTRLIEKLERDLSQ